jgi:hypothetical protein
VAEGLRQLREVEVLTPVKALAPPRAETSTGQSRRWSRAVVMERRYKRRLKEILVASILFGLTKGITRLWGKDQNQEEAEIGKDFMKLKTPKKVRFGGKFWCLAEEVDSDEEDVS